MTLELKHLSPYLPYEVEFQDLSYCYNPIKKLNPTNLYFYRFDISKIKPILRPLSDLTKEIEVNGEKFVPIDRLYELRQTDIEFDFLRAIEDDWASANDKLEFAPYSINQKLFEWHFDVFGLIEKGLAIDINTLS